MTGTTAHDLCVTEARRWARILANAGHIGTSRMIAKAERRLARARAAAREWAAQPALGCTLTREGDRVVVRSKLDGRRICSGADGREAQRKAIKWGFRSIDLTALGVHSFGD